MIKNIITIFKRESWQDYAQGEVAASNTKSEIECRAELFFVAAHLGLDIHERNEASVMDFVN